MKSLNVTSAPASQPTIEVVEVAPYVDKLRDRWPIVFGITLACIGIGLAVMLLQPPEWEVSSSLYFPIRPISLLAVPNSPSAVSSAAIGLGGPNPLNVNQTIVQSQTVLDYVQSRVPRSREWLERKLNVRPDLTSSMLILSVNDRNVDLARRIVRAYVEGLRQVTRALNVQPMSLDLNKLHATLDERERQVDEDQKELLAFQKVQTTPTQILSSGGGDNSSLLVLPGSWLEQMKTSELELKRLTALESEAKSLIERMSSSPVSLPTEVPVAQKWRERLAEQEYQLRVAKLTQPDSSPTVQMLQAQADLTKKELAEQVSQYFKAVHMNVAAPDYLDLVARRMATEAELGAVKRLADSAPGQAAEYQRLLTEFATSNAIVQKLKGQVATAELNSQMDPYGFQLLDDARVSNKPINKSFAKTTAIWGFIGLLIGTLFALLRRPSGPSQR